MHCNCDLGSVCLSIFSFPFPFLEYKAPGDNCVSSGMSIEDFGTSSFLLGTYLIYFKMNGNIILL